MAIALRPQICDVTSPYVYATVRRRNCTVRERRVECLKRDKKPQSFSSDVKLDCRAVTLPRSETRLNLQGCSKLPKRSQPLVGQSSPYYDDTWRRYCCLTGFSDCRCMLSCEDTARRSCAMVPRWRFFCVIFASCISSELHATLFSPAL